jgi:hypothetical protein
MTPATRITFLFVLSIFGLSACCGSSGGGGGNPPLDPPDPPADTEFTWEDDNWDERNWQ